MRKKYTGSYNKFGAFELRKASGQVEKTIEPNDVFSVDNSFGGYWAKPITYGGERRLALIRLSQKWKMRCISPAHFGHEAVIN